ncbi:MAG: metallophosphoesterase [Nitrospirae bacterium]|nr:metallophosphoesterase [Nitrospirota bacterium]
MLTGIVSDTHDDMAALRKAVEIFNEEKVSHVLHAGDLVSPFTFDIFEGLTCGFTGIFGNNDGDKLLLRERFGGRIYNQPHVTTIAEKKVILVHEPDLVEALADSGHFDLVIYGHTHKPDVRKAGSTLIVNPGKLARLHKGLSTLAILDVETMNARIVTL